MTVYNIYRYTENPTAGIRKVFLRGFADVKDATEYHKQFEQMKNYVWHIIEVEY